jgi:endo-1,4-beta-xylanase
MADKGTIHELKALRDTYRDYFDIGAAVNLDTIHSQKELLKKHFNSVTAENDMKFERVHPSEGIYTFDAADQIVDFAAACGMKIRGHTLVWHNQTPGWVFEDGKGGFCSREELLKRMKDHIHTVAGRYKGLVYGWDVVNEAVEDKSEIWLRDSRWLSIIGQDFIAEAFRMAHEADPKALLFYNDYNECNPEKRDKIIRLLKQLKDQDVPVHGMGMQGHWSLKGPSIEEIRAAIEAYASLGLKLQVTELDVSVFEFDDRRTDLTAPAPEMLELQAERYSQIFRLFREYKDVLTAVTFWGAADDYTWLDDFPVRGRKNWPFVFDEAHCPKESFHRISSFL